MHTDNTENNSVVVGGSQKGKNRRLKIPRLNKAVIVICLLILVVASAAYMYLNYEKPAIKVGGSSISKEQYEQFKGEYKKYDEPSIKNEKELQAYIVDTLKTREVADAYDIAVTDAEKQNFAANFFNLEDVKASSWQLMVAESQLYESKVEKKTIGADYVAQITVPFSSTFVFSPSNVNDAPPAKFGNPANIKATTQDARKQIEQYAASMTENLTADNAQKIIEEVFNNKQFQYGYTKNESAVFYVDKDGLRMGDGSTGGISLGKQNAARLSSLKSGVSKIYTETGNNLSSVPGYEGKNVPIAYYFFVKLQQNSPDAELTSNINSDKNSIKAEINV